MWQLVPYSSSLFRRYRNDIEIHNKPDNYGRYVIHVALCISISVQQKEAKYKRHLQKNILFIKGAERRIFGDNCQSLSTEKNRLYAEIHKLKAEVQEVEAVKKCVEQTVQPRQTRAKTQSRKSDMEL